MTMYNSSIVSKIFHLRLSKLDRREKTTFGFKKGPDGFLYGFVFRVIAAFGSAMVWGLPVILFGALNGWTLNVALVYLYAIGVFSTVGICELLRHRVYEDINGSVTSVHKDGYSNGDITKINSIAAAYAGKSQSSLLVKYIVETILAYVMAVLLAPLLIAISIMIVFESRGPILFRFRRVGAKGRIFYSYKFRTMFMAETDKTSKEPYSVAGHVTPLGRLLRRSNIDSLPLIFNVLQGNMALVGPRPIRVEEAEAYRSKNELYLRRLLVRPGITGWAQLREPFYHASSVDGQDMLKLDAWYVDHRTVNLDLRILLQTIFSVSRRDAMK